MDAKAFQDLIDRLLLSKWYQSLGLFETRNIVLGIDSIFF